MLRAAGLTVHRGGAPVLEDVSLVLDASSRVGVVGRNGVGKTTLLRVLAGLEAPDAGTVARSPSTLTVGLLPQETDARPGETLLEYLARRTGVADASAALDRRADALAAGADDAAIAAHAEALETFLALGGDDLAARAAEVTADVGLPAARLDVAVTDLSGGQRARAALAAVLLARFDLLLLDEPTNDLDFAGLEQLESFLVGRPGYVVVSHDRAFLDRCVDRIVEIDEASHRASEFAGGWSDYVAARELDRAQRHAAWERGEAERGRLVERLRTQRSWSEEGVRRRKKRPRDNDKVQRKFMADRTERQAAKVRATEKALARVERVDKPWEPWELRLELRAADRAGDVVARLDGAVVDRGDFRLGPLDLELGWRDRLAVVGPNGSGKSTLIGALLGRLPLAAGARRLGPGVVAGDLDQGRVGLGDDPLLDAVVAATGLLPGDARSLLAKFGLGADHVGRPPAALSPGERTRAQLAVLSARGVNLLVLDEPTNHLDLEAIEQLESALAGFDGTLVLVSHDRRLLEAVHVTRTVELAPAV